MLTVARFFEKMRGMVYTEKRKANFRERVQGMQKEQKKRISGNRRRIFLAAAAAGLNLAACFRPFCDFYKRTIYGVVADVLGMLTGWIPFSIGEFSVYLAVIWLFAAAAVLLTVWFMKKGGRARKFASSFLRISLETFLWLILILTLNYVIPFRGSILEVEGSVKREYTLQEIQNVRNHLVTQINALAQEVARQEDGKILYDRKKLQEEVFASMKKLGKEYPLLSGYYPPMKAAAGSDLMDWMNIGGVVFPHTMELIWNVYCTDLYYPSLLAHESAHHQGYYLENEANYIAFRACIQSGDALVRYSGYLDVFYYVNDAYYRTLERVYGDVKTAREEYYRQPQLSERVKQDRSEAREASEEKYQADSHPAQKLAPAASDVADVGWNLQEEVLQENCYDGVVELVLQYYDVQTPGWKDVG